MKSLFKIAFSLLVGLCVCTACEDTNKEGVTGFQLDAEEVTLGAEGGTQTINVAAGTKWVAKTDQPWVQILPANGIGSVECKVVVDSTLRNDIRSATITFVPEGLEAKKLKINQTGFGKMIGLSIEEVSVPNMGVYGKRFFDLSVTTNVDFDINITTEAQDQSWLKKPDHNVDLNAGARPRTVKLRFEWNMNTDPKERLAEVIFSSKNEADAIKPVVLNVKQEAAPEIEDNRGGDSLALIIIQEKLRSMSKWDTSERMDYWLGVKLWERKDKEVAENPKMLGRVRSVSYLMLKTEEGLPQEVSKLKYAESLSFGSNSNTMLLFNLSTGTGICELEHLKRLSLFAYGFEVLPDEFKKLGKTLEYLELSANNFNSIPAVLTPENFPKLKSLHLSTMRRYSGNTDIRNDQRPSPGLRIDNANTSVDLKRLLMWEKLEYLSLGNCLISGSLPAMISDVPKYSETDIAQNDTLNNPQAKAKLLTLPKVLPNMRRLSLNLNYLSGKLPDWLLYHPRLASWGPYSLLFPQEEGSYDAFGRLPGFTNVPLNLDYYYDLYPLTKPVKSE